jgi:hypothetical protein
MGGRKTIQLNHCRLSFRVSSCSGLNNTMANIVQHIKKICLVGHRASWGILPQTPVFSLRSARCHWECLITARKARHHFIAALIEHPGPKDLLVSHRTSWGVLPQTLVFSLRSRPCQFRIQRQCCQKGIVDETSRWY